MRRKFANSNFGLTCAVAFIGFVLFNRLATVKMQWREVKRIFRRDDSGLNERQDMQDNLALGQPWSSELNSRTQ